MRKLFLACAAIIILAGAFIGGIYYNKTSGAGVSAQAAGNPQSAFGNFQRGQRLNTNGQAPARTSASENMIRGEILSADKDSITVKTESNGSKIVMLSGGTQITETTSVDPKNLTEGKTVMITGATNDDGTISANTISIREINMPSTGSVGTEEKKAE